MRVLIRLEAGVSARPRVDPHCVHLCVDPAGIHMGQLIAERGQLHVAKTCGQYINEDVLHIKETIEQSQRVHGNK